MKRTIPDTQAPEKKQKKVTSKEYLLRQFVFPFLCCVDAYAWCLASPRVGACVLGTFHAKLLQTIHKSLTRAGLNAKWFCQMLQQHNGFLSGSFVLHAIFEETDWQPDDIDVLSAFQCDDPLLFALLDELSVPVPSFTTLKNKVVSVQSFTTMKRDIVLDCSSPRLPIAHEWVTPVGTKHPMRIQQTKRTFCRVYNSRTGIWDDRNDVPYFPDAHPMGKNFVETTISNDEHNGQVEHRSFLQNIRTTRSRQYPHTLPISSRTFAFRDVSLPVNHIHVCLQPPMLQSSPRSTVMRYVRDYFDVGFCQLLFDGERLMVKNWTDVFARSSDVDWQHYLAIHAPMYKLNPHPPYTSSQDHDPAAKQWLFSRLCDRRLKYAVRGFCINLDVPLEATQYRNVEDWYGAAESS